MNAMPIASVIADAAPLYDPLTGLLSRAAVLETLGRTLSLADRLQLPVTVLFIAIDGQEPHRPHVPQPAEAMEQALAGRMARRMRTHDVLGHWARGQFVAVLPDADVASALVLAEDLSELARMPSWPGLSVSVGVHGREPTRTQGLHGLAAEMVVGAQRALETTEANGPNRIEIEPAPPV